MGGGTAPVPWATKRRPYADMMARPCLGLSRNIESLCCMFSLPINLIDNAIGILYDKYACSRWHAVAGASRPRCGVVTVCYRF
jgi:hypothetical protein